MLIFVEALLLTATLSVDSLASAISYGINKSVIVIFEVKVQNTAFKQGNNAINQKGKYSPPDYKAKQRNKKQS